VVRTCRFLNDGRRQIDAFHAAGDVFGIEAGDGHRLGAETVSECYVIAYRRRGLEAMMFQDDRLGRWFFSYALAMLARAREHSLLLERGTAAQKISVFLLEIETQQGRAKSVDLAMSRQDIADYLGLTIETVSRTLSQMERDGTIRADHRSAGHSEGSPDATGAEFLTCDCVTGLRSAMASQPCRCD